MKYLLSLVFLFLFSFSISAQNLDDVFDDGGLSNIKNNINFSLSDAVEGFLNIGYDRYLGSHSSLGLSFGVFIYNGYPLHFGEYDNYPNKNPINYEGGFMIHFRYRSYFRDFDGFYWQYGFMYQKTYRGNIDYILLSIPEIKVGWRFEITNRISILSSIGFGFGLYSTKNHSDKGILGVSNNSNFYIPLNVEAAYNF